MKITEKELRKLVRDKLVREVLLESESSMHSEEEALHAQLERQPVNDANLMRKGDASYQETVKRLPAAKAGIDWVFSEFELAKRRRLNYLESQFPARYNALKDKLGDKADVDVRHLQGVMIYRVRRAVLKIGTYGTDIKQNGYGVKTYEAAFDPTSGWAKTLGSLGKSTHIRAFAPSDDGSVVMAPPHLLLDDANDVTGAFEDSETGKFLEHELIHQEDYAASIVLAGDAGTEEKVGQSASLSKDLIVKSMIPPQQLTDKIIRQRLASSPALAEEIRLVSYLFPDMTKLETPAAKETADVLVVARYAKALAAEVDVYKILYYQIASQFPEDKNLGDPDARALFELDDNTRDITKRNADMTSSSHLRITLSLMLPHLQAALSESKDPGAVIESTLKGMKGAAMSEDRNRSAHILAVTDPAKLADLTLVAMGGKKKRPADTSPGEKTALAERWMHLAGILSQP